MNYGKMLDQHKDSGADVAVTLQVDPGSVSQFGVVEVARNGDVTGFQEKPKETSARSPFNPYKVDASMGIYIFNTDAIFACADQRCRRSNLETRLGYNTSSRDSGQVQDDGFQLHHENRQDAHWRDVGTLEAYGPKQIWMLAWFRRSSICMTKRGRCKPHGYPPAKFVLAKPGRSGVAIIWLTPKAASFQRAVVRNSVLSQDVRINSYAGN